MHHTQSILGEDAEIPLVPTAAFVLWQALLVANSLMPTRLEENPHISYL
jgi:hypothetical protein